MLVELFRSLGMIVTKKSLGLSAGFGVCGGKIKWGIEVIRKHPEFLHVKIVENTTCWFFTIVYGSSNFVSRRQLWELLKLIGEDMSEQWAIAGDFNAFLFEHEKRGEVVLEVDPMWVLLIGLIVTL